ncbi:MAG: hypothetical protein Kow0068_05900 [Marinilabiliales bacterium]
MPIVLKEYGLVKAISDLLNKCFYKTGINYEFESFNIEERFNEDIELNIYRIAQELVGNILKHSKAKNVNVQLLYNEGNLILIFEDDGIGFIYNVHHAGLGLKNILSRTESINGHFHFEKGIDKGTVSFLRVKIS